MLTAMRNTLPLLLMPFLATNAVPSAAQHIPDDPTCPRCTIDVTIDARLEDPGGDRAFVPPVSVSVDSDGRMWVWGAAPILIYEEDGAFVRTLGRAGQGPGEFSSRIRAALPVGDSMAVFEAGGRVTVFGPDFEVVRTTALPFGPNLALGSSVSLLRWPTRVLFNARQNAAARPPLHLADLSAATPRLHSSFGDHDAPRVSSSFLSRRLGAANRGSAWVADWMDYRLDRIDAEGRVLQSLTRSPDWFPEYVGPVLIDDRTGPSPYIDAVVEDAAGRLWIAMRIAATGWRQILDDARAACPTDFCPPPEAIYQTVIDVIDPAAMRVVTRSHLDWRIIDALPDGRFVAYAEEALIPVLYVLRLELRERPNTSGDDPLSLVGPWRARWREEWRNGSLISG